MMRIVLMMQWKTGYTVPSLPACFGKAVYATIRVGESDVLADGWVRSDSFGDHGNSVVGVRFSGKRHHSPMSTTALVWRTD